MAPIRCCFDQTAVWHSDAARGPSTPSFDHLVGAGGEHRRDFNAERLRSLEIDDELEAGRLRGGEVGRLGTLENTPGVDAGLAKSIDQAGAVARQAAENDKVAPFIDRWHHMLRR